MPDDTRTGLLRGLTYAQYHAIEAANQSRLKLFKRSAAHVQQEILSPGEPTAAQDMGHATHGSVLEPETFETLYIGAPKLDRRTKEGKAKWAAFNAEHADKTVMKAEDFDQCRYLAEAVWKDETGSELLKGKGINETSAVWKDASTGLLCKLRLDRLTDFAGYPTILDVKTAEDASERGFARAIDKYDYHLQAAFYLDGLETISPMDRRFVFLVVEKKPPYCVACYELDLGSIELGRSEYEEYLATYKQCVESGVWPGYPSGIQPISLPPWRFKRVEE